MKGPGVGVERKTVLVFEYVTGGGMAGRDLPASWAAEGAAMRRVIVEDFAAVPGVRVVATVDPRVPFEAAPGVEMRVLSDGESSLQRLAANADYTLLIAPEMDGILSRLTGMVEGSGARLLGSSRKAVEFVGDKARLAEHFIARGIPTPPTLTLGRPAMDLPAEWEGLVVIKPRWGAGSVDTFVRHRRYKPWEGLDGTFVAQPYILGEPMSASFLVDVTGQVHFLAVGRQRIVLDEAGRISYRGGVLNVRWNPVVVFTAILSVQEEMGSGLRGFIGVDFLVDAREAGVVLEINPRPTTSYVGLARLFPPGTVAGTWLAAMNGPLKGTCWPGRLQEGREAPVVAFDADGTIHAEDSSK